MNILQTYGNLCELHCGGAWSLTPGHLHPELERQCQQLHLLNGYPLMAAMAVSMSSWCLGHHRKKKRRAQALLDTCAALRCHHAAWKASCTGSQLCRSPCKVVQMPGASRRWPAIMGYRPAPQHSE